MASPTDKELGARAEVFAAQQLPTDFPDEALTRAMRLAVAAAFALGYRAGEADAKDGLRGRAP